MGKLRISNFSESTTQRYIKFTGSVPEKDCTSFYTAYDRCNLSVIRHTFNAEDALAFEKECDDFEILLDPKNQHIIEDIIENIVYDLNISFSSIDIPYASTDFSVLKPISIPVKVVGGRKNRGVNGILLYSRQYYNNYTGGTDSKFYIFNPDKLEIVEVNSFSYLEIDKTWLNIYNNNIVNSIRKDVESIVNLVSLYSFNKSGRDIKEKIHAIAAKNLFDNISLTPELEKFIKQKNDEFDTYKKAEMPNIIKWVKENTDKKDENDILKLAEHIFNKRNKINYEK